MSVFTRVKLNSDTVEEALISEVSMNSVVEQTQLAPTGFVVTGQRVSFLDM